MKKAVTVLLAIVLFAQLFSVSVYADYKFATCIVPEDTDTVDSMIIYFKEYSTYLVSKGKKAKSLFCFADDIAKVIAADNPTSIVISGRYSKNFHTFAEDYIKKYHITDVTVMGWSAGGNDVITTAAELIEAFEDRVPNILLIDCNHTDGLSDGLFKSIKERGSSIWYFLTLACKAKNEALTKIRKYDIPLNYIRFSVPDDYMGSKHIACRNAAILFNIAGWIRDGADGFLPDCLSLGYFDYESKAIVLE